MTALTILGPGLLAGVVALLATLAVERFGGRLGGLLATLPTTVVPAVWGMAAGAADPRAFTDGVGTVPVGMLVNAVFLWTWRVVPERLPAGPLWQRLMAMTGVSLMVWAGLAAGAVAMLDRVRSAGLPILGVGAAAMAVTVGIGVVASRKRIAAPSVRKAVPVVSLLARGFMAALAIAGSAALAASGSALLAGMASVFPAIFLTTMVALWWSQGDLLPVSAVGPMMLGSASVSAYALAAAWMVPAWGIGLGSLGAWILAVSFVTWPAHMWISRD